MKGLLTDDPLWYKDAIIYEARVRSFYDQDGDGLGDLRGITAKLDYLQELGINAIWLLPFYPSPQRDDGYDISDYTDVHPETGTLHDFKVFLREAHARGLRVITELVLNHTSDQHAMFQRARRAPPGSKERDFYVWSDDPERYKEARIIFKDFEHSNWSWDPVAQAYYWHRFYSHQPDLNFENPEVRRFVRQALDFWLDLGVDGLRLDAVPYLYEREGTNCENLPETHAFLIELRRHIDKHYRNRMLLAEANQWPEDAVAYFGPEGEESHMAFHFPIMPRMFMALRMEDRFPLIEIISQTPPIPEPSQWALFLRNHDELTLEMVTDEERDYMYRVYAQDPQARINLGIRRRLAPLVGNDRRRIELLNGLLFSMPGTPVVYYGDEIGMGDNIYLGDRNGVRTPMQWSADRNAGFSRANPQRLFLPVIVDPEYHYQTVNVETQLANPQSLLNWTRELIALRKRFTAFGRGSIQFLYPDNPRVLAFLRRHGDQVLLVVANLSRHAQFVELDLSAFAGLTPMELFGRMPFPKIGTLPYLVTLGSHGFFWFALEKPREAAALKAEQPPTQVIQVRNRWEDVLRGPSKSALEELLPAWFAAADWAPEELHAIRGAKIREVLPVGEPTPVAWIALVDVETSDGAAPRTYVLPLAFTSGEAADRLETTHPHAVVVRVRGERGRFEGALHYALFDSAFGVGLLRMFSRGRRGKQEEGQLMLTRLAGFDEIRITAESDVKPAVLREDRGSTMMGYGDRAVIKMFHFVEPGVNSDIELSRFLVEKAGFQSTPPIVGVIEYRRGRGKPMALGVVRKHVPNQGDGWQYTLQQVHRYFERVEALGDASVEELMAEAHLSTVELSAREPSVQARELMGEYIESAALIGRRTAEYQVALTSDLSDPDFRPEPFSTLYRRSRYQSARNRVRQVFQRLRRVRRDLDDVARAEAERVLAAEERILQICRGFLDAKLMGHSIRCHGRYRLKQLIYTGDDFLVSDFEGEPTTTYSERRNKRSPMRDVSAMLRSFHYAAFAPLLGPASAEAAPPELSRLMPWAGLWQAHASAGFFRAWHEIAARSGFLPQAREQVGTLMDLYLLEEAVYSLGYELGNRPDWVRIPLHAIIQVLHD